MVKYAKKLRLRENPPAPQNNNTASARAPPIGGEFGKKVTNGADGGWRNRKMGRYD